MKGMADHSPPPPAGATRPPPLEEQRLAVNKTLQEAQVMEPGDVWFAVSAIWHDHWLKFVASSEGGAASQELHPGRIDNSVLAAGEGSKELNREVCLRAASWNGGVGHGWN